MSKLFLGVDGGQSGTTVLIGDETGRVVAAGRGGPCYRFRESLNEALESAGIESEFEAACLGLSGGSGGREEIARELIRANHYSFTHDAAIALTGAAGGGPGIIAIAGTGSIIFGRNAEGREARAGGWGYVFGDEGGAFDIVRQALRAALRFEEGWGPKTILLSMFCEATGATGANHLLHRWADAGYPRDQIAALANLIGEAEKAGDGIARDLLRASAQALATYAAAIRARLFMEGEIVNVFYSGGMFRDRLFRERFRMLVELDDGNKMLAPKYGPAAGALIEAYRLAGVSCELQDVPAEKA